MKNIILSAAAATAIIAVSASSISCTGKGWSGEEREIILGQVETMRVLTVDSEADSIVLRKHCKELTSKELNENVENMLENLADVSRQIGEITERTGKVKADVLT